MRTSHIIIVNVLVSAFAASAAHAETGRVIQVQNAASCSAVMTSALGDQELVGQSVMIAPARFETRTTPAQYEWAFRQELVSPQKVEQHTSPAVYAPVTETTVVTPARVEYHQIPPSYQTVNQVVMVGPPPSVTTVAYAPTGYWAGGYSTVGYMAPYPVQYAAAYPTQYATVQAQVIDSPGYVVQAVVPAVTQVKTRNVLVKPTETYETVTPPVYRQVQYLREVAPARTETVEISAVYETRRSTGIVACAPVVTQQAVVVSQQAAVVTQQSPVVIRQTPVAWQQLDTAVSAH